MYYILNSRVRNSLQLILSLVCNYHIFCFQKHSLGKCNCSTKECFSAYAYLCSYDLLHFYSWNILSSSNNELFSICNEDCRLLGNNSIHHNSSYRKHSSFLSQAMLVQLFFSFFFGICLWKKNKVLSLLLINLVIEFKEPRLVDIIRCGQCHFIGPATCTLLQCCQYTMINK